MCQGILVLSSVRVKRHPRYKFIPFCYTRYLFTSSKRKAAYVLAFISIAAVIALSLFFRFYIFEADIKLVYLDDLDDYQREITDGTASISVAGWKYRNTIDYKNLMGGKSVHDIERDTTNKGYWIFKAEKSDSTLRNNIILGDFQFWRNHDIALALRYYTHDFAKIIINFESVLGQVHYTVLDSFPTMTSKNSSHLCTLFILPPFKGFVEKIRISSVTSRSSFAIIDKIILAVGNDNRGLHMLFTLQPEDWCDNVMGNNVVNSSAFSLPWTKSP
jgi:hypothetical protein